MTKRKFDEVETNNNLTLTPRSITIWTREYKLHAAANFGDAGRKLNKPDWTPDYISKAYFEYIESESGEPLEQHDGRYILNQNEKEIGRMYHNKREAYRTQCQDLYGDMWQNISKESRMLLGKQEDKQDEATHEQDPFALFKLCQTTHKVKLMAASREENADASNKIHVFRQCDPKTGIVTEFEQHCLNFDELIDHAKALDQTLDNFDVIYWFLKSIYPKDIQHDLSQLLAKDGGPGKPPQKGYPLTLAEAKQAVRRILHRNRDFVEEQRGDTSHSRATRHPEVPTRLLVE